MNDMLDRSIVSHAVIIVSLCLGGWMLFVKPRADRFAEIEQAIAESASSDAMDEPTVKHMAQLVTNYRDRCAQLERFNAVGRSTSRLYGSISRMAEANNVEVARLEPGRSRQPLAGGDGTRTLLDMTVRGSFQDVTRFIEDVEGMLGFVRPAMLTVTPGPNDQAGVVDMRANLEILEFNLPVIMTEHASQGDSDVDA